MTYYDGDGRGTIISKISLKGDGPRTLLGAPGLTTRNKKLLETRDKYE